MNCRKLCITFGGILLLIALVWVNSFIIHLLPDGDWLHTGKWWAFPVIISSWLPSGLVLITYITWAEKQ